MALFSPVYCRASASRRARARLELRPTPRDVARLSSQVRFTSLVRYSERQSHCSLNAGYAARTFSLLTVVERSRAVTARTLPCFLSSQPSELKFDTTPKARASSVRRRRRGALPAGNRYRLCQTPADVVPRESCRRSSGRRPFSRPATDDREFNVTSRAS